MKTYTISTTGANGLDSRKGIHLKNILALVMMLICMRPSGTKGK